MTKLKMFHLTIFLVMVSTFAQDLDNNKCGGCPCNTPCNNPTPSPPPPSPPPPPPPPPPKKPTTPSSYCPPPPNSGTGTGSGSGGGNTPSPPYIYVNGPPGNIYPVDHFYSGSGRSFCVGLFQFLIGSVVWLLA